MRKAIIALFFALLVSIASAAENESVQNINSLGNSGDLPVTSAEAVANEIQAGSISIEEGVENAAEIPGTNAINPAIESSVDSDAAPLTGKKPVTASFGVYLNIVG